MIIDCISDLHGYYPELEGGDLLIVAGDLTAGDTVHQHMQFQIWLHDQPYRKKVVIAGNHDNRLQKLPPKGIEKQYSEMGEDYLCDSGTEFEGLNIWGSPWTRTFEGMNPHCMAFTLDTEEELKRKWRLIPSDTDILITHSPPYGILDKVSYINEGEDEAEHVGSTSLAARIGHLETPPKLWVWGHIHEAYGIDPVIRSRPCKMVNASHVNEKYQPVNPPIRIEL